MEPLFQMTPPALRAIAFCSRFSWCLLGLLILLPPSALASNPTPASTRPPDPPSTPDARPETSRRLELQGFGFLEGRRLKRQLHSMTVGDYPSSQTHFNANDLENFLLLLSSSVRREGFLQAVFTINATAPDARPLPAQTWSHGSLPTWPPDFTAAELTLAVRKGPRFFYQSISFLPFPSNDPIPNAANPAESLKPLFPAPLTAAKAQTYFFTEGYWLQSRADRAYSPDFFAASQTRLQNALQQIGYLDAHVGGRETQRNPQTGAVSVQILVDPGPFYRLKSWKAVIGNGTAPTDERSPETSSTASFRLVDSTHLQAARKALPEGWQTAAPNQPFTRFWQQEQATNLRNRLHSIGFPGPLIRFESQPLPASGNTVSNPQQDPQIIDTQAVFTIDPGPRVKVASIRFSGDEHTHPATFARAVATRPGQWLNPLQVEEDRFQLARTGLFRRLQAKSLPAATPIPAAERASSENLFSTHFPPPDPLAFPLPDEWRDLRFELQPATRMEIDLLLGYGTYEQLRAGLFAQRNNLWGRAHSDHIRFLQSFKSSQIDYRYRMPGFFDRRNSLAFEIAALRREELSFTREETSYELRLTRELKFLPRAHLSLAHRLEHFDATAIDLAPRSTIEPAARIGSLLATFHWEQRDDPVYPTSGFSLRTQFKFSSDWFGGEQDYQKSRLFASAHFPLRETTFLHLGFSHGSLTSPGFDSNGIPLGERFLPGGDNSIRGYSEGEAGPRDENGNFIGAETFSLAQIEIEQRLRPSLGLVLFFDHLSAAKSISDFPASYNLLSAGLGLRYRTPLGPLRLEFAQNLQKRSQDPDWAWHLSLGVPF